MSYLALIEAERNGSGGGLVDDAQHIETADGAGVLLESKLITCEKITDVRARLPWWPDAERR